MGTSLFNHFATLTAPPVCNSQDQITNLWVGLAQQALAQIDQLIDSPMLYATCISALLLVLLVRSLRRRRWLVSAVAVICLSIVLVKSSIFVSVGNRMLVQALPPDLGQPTDAIVVLGRGGELRPQRVETALDLWRGDRAPRIFASGRGDGAEIMAELRKLGVPAEVVDQESCSRTTEENAQLTAALLFPQGVRRIILVTDPPHLMRSFLTFRSFGFEVVPHSSPLPNRMGYPSQRRLVMRESFGLLTYGLLGRYFPRSDRPIANASIAVRAEHQL